VIFGFSHFPVGAGKTSKQTLRKTTQTGVPVTVIESRTPAQIYDLAHQRRLKALQFYIEKGYPLNVAARLVEAAQ
jgi:glutamyl-tRNA reductase